MATTETTETTETLRAAIEAAMRRRDPEAIVSAIDAAYEGLAMTGVIVVGVRMRAVAPATADALRALALACGLRVETCGACNGRGRHDYAREVEDGCDACECAGVVVVDPAAEVERLTQEVATLTRERDEARASVNELASQQQRLMAMIGAQTAEKVRLLTDLADTRAALRAHLHCDECEELATRTHAETASFGCDAHGIGEGWSDTTHAAAVRAAMEGGR